MQNHLFNWVEDEDTFIAKIADGRVLITQVRDHGTPWYQFGTRNFRLRIEYHDGTIEVVKHLFESFGAAEGWAYLTIQERESQHHHQEEVDGLLTTLAHCKQHLASEDKSLHEQRLARIVEVIKKYYGLEL